MIALALALLTAVVVEDGSAVRAAPSDHAPLKYEAAAGAWLEVRGEESGYLRVYDHFRERPGFIRSWRVRTYDLEAADVARDLAAIVRFLGHAPGRESLLIGHAALHLRVDDDDERLVASHDAIGMAADRLARQASSRGGSRDATLASHVAVAEGHGAEFVSVVDGEHSRLCYDGAAFRHVLAASTDPTRKARAALMLTQRRCLPPGAGEAMLDSWNDWRLDVLDRAGLDGLDESLAARLRLRRAEALVRRSYSRGRRGSGGGAADDAAKDAAVALEEAIELVAGVDRGVLLREHRHEHDEAAVRVAAARGALGDGAELSLSSLTDGRTCIQLPAAGPPPAGPPPAGPPPAGPPAEDGDSAHEYCTHGVVWPGSVRRSSDGATVTASVQMTESWTELMVFRLGADGWRSDPLVPSLDGPGVGYVELAGFVPGAGRLLVVRESWRRAALERSFEVVSLEDLAVVSIAPRPGPAFRRWATREWRSSTLALR